MSHTHDFINREIDATFRGEATEPGLAPVANWADALRQAAHVDVDDLMATAHVTAAIAAITEAAPVGPSESAAPTPRARRRFVLSTFLSTLVGKILAGGVALATVTGGVAATGALPDAVQDPIAGVYAMVGFDFPSSDDDVDNADIEDSDDAEDADIEDSDDAEDADIEDSDDAEIEDADDADSDDDAIDDSDDADADDADDDSDDEDSDDAEIEDADDADSDDDAIDDSDDEDADDADDDSDDAEIEDADDAEDDNTDEADIEDGEQ